MHLSSRQRHHFPYTLMGIVVEKPFDFGIIPKIQNTLNNISSVYLCVYSFRVNIPKKRLAKLHIYIIPYFSILM